MRRRGTVHVLDKRQYVTIAVFLRGLVFRRRQTDRAERAETAFHLDHHRPVFPPGPEIETVAAAIGNGGPTTTTGTGRRRSLPPWP